MGTIDAPCPFSVVGGRRRGRRSSQISRRAALYALDLRAPPLREVLDGTTSSDVMVFFVLTERTKPEEAFCVTTW
jgi:hypothetical protein